MRHYREMSQVGCKKPWIVFDRPIPQNAHMQKRLNTLTWIVIGVLFVATAVWTVWASRQPGGHSMWAPNSESLPP